MRRAWLCGLTAVCLGVLVGCETSSGDDDDDDDYGSQEYDDPECIEAPDDCEDAGSCCSGAVCIEFAGGDLLGSYCADECTSDSMCVSGCCNTTDSGAFRVCSPTEYCD
jgi:hypothetical protein